MTSPTLKLMSALAFQTAQIHLSHLMVNTLIVHYYLFISIDID